MRLCNCECKLSLTEGENMLMFPGPITAKQADRVCIYIFSRFNNPGKGPWATLEASQSSLGPQPFTSLSFTPEKEKAHGN